MNASSDVDATRLDGNAAAGILGEIFAADVTSARATCLHCGASESVGGLHCYAHEMGAILRCPGCASVVLRATRTPTHLWLDATGARILVLPVPEAIA